MQPREWGSNDTGVAYLESAVREAGENADHVANGQNDRRTNRWGTRVVRGLDRDGASFDMLIYVLAWLVDTRVQR